MRKLPILTVLAAILAFGATSAQAAAKPTVLATWVTTVSSTSANLRAEVNPESQPTTYRFEITTEADFLDHGFNGAATVPNGGEVPIGQGGVPVPVVQHPGSLTSATSYRYRVVATNGSGTTEGPVRPLITDEDAPTFSLPDGRGWEMVSPIDKNGGSIQNFGGNLGGGVIQAAAQGGAVTYTSASAFANAEGAPGASQYIGRRNSSGWSTDNVNPTAVSGGYLESPTSGVPYQLFAADLLSGLVTNGRRCRASDSNHCPVENPALPGSGAPPGFRNYYLRDNSSNSYQATLTSADIATLALGSDEFELAFAGATPDLAHVVLSTCAALTPGSTEVPGSGGECDPAKQNLYEKSGSELKLINNAPGATLAAQSGAISADGSRVYWTDGSNLYLTDGSTVSQVDGAQLGGGTFEAAATDDSVVAFFTKGGHLFRYVGSGGVTDLTPAGGVQGVLGASEDGADVYYLSAAGLFLWSSGTTTLVASGADDDSYPPTTGTARVSADGQHLAFVSSDELTIFDNRGFDEVYLYTAPEGAGEGSLVCASCNPSGELPIGSASLPGASANGTGTNAPHFYKPRALSADSTRVFFDSFDALVPQDTNSDRDVYQWELPGSGGCARPGGCVGLISSGRASNGASFLDASADGSDAFFLTDDSLDPSDPGADDVYDARVGGGFPPLESVIPCFGDTCQPLPPEPEDPTPGTLRTKTSGNLPPPTRKKPLKCKKSQVKRFGKCVKKKPQKRKRG